MLQQVVPKGEHVTITVPAFSLDASGMVYTHLPLICSRCAYTYFDGCLMEIRGIGLFCFSCFRTVFEDYFRTHPDEDYVLFRGVYSLATPRRKEKPARGKPKGGRDS